MTNTSANSKQIAKNSLLLYTRMLFMMAVSLYTSRIILKYLGIIDYGIYNIVGGIIIMLSFFNTCMFSATQRFLTFELARGDIKKLKETFVTSLNIHIIICIIVISLAESLGLYFLNYYLNIPSNKYFAANIVYQCTIIIFCINLIQIPYNAVLIAHERMNIYAYLSLLEVILKLAIVYILGLFTNNRLIIYGGLMVVVQLIIRLSYQFYCKRHYKECSFILYFDKKTFKKMISFAGWSMFGSIAWLLRDQGINIVLNLFFGPAINAAKGISSQVSNAVITFVANFLTAINPQITKNYATGKIKEMEKLTYAGIKYSFILVTLIAIPIILNINEILSLWLSEIPIYTSQFIILLIVDIMLGTLMGANPLLTALSATGNIKKPQLAVSLIIALILPTSYFILKTGSKPYEVFYAYLFYTLIAGIVRLYYAKKMIRFSLITFYKKVFIPSCNMLICTIPVLIFVKYHLFQNVQNYLFNIIINSLFSILYIAIIFWSIAMNKTERRIIINIIENKIFKKNKQ